MNPAINRVHNVTTRQRWRSRHQLRHNMLPGRWNSWLFDENSLTKRLQQRCRGRFSVEVLSEEVCQPQANEIRRLGMGLRRWARIRQVLLLCDETPWVVARTIIPLSTLRGPLRRLRHLKNRPLGAFLFADPHLERSDIEVSQLPTSAPPLSLILHRFEGHEEINWGRRSLFKLNDQPVLVSEIFLETLLTN
ncbi:MAG: chorismate lyase [Gammaproteobacteria bacterium]|nr:chorismate lyase [Gammaproteobacteria bacterium]